MQLTQSRLGKVEPEYKTNIAKSEKISNKKYSMDATSLKMMIKEPK